MDGNTLINLAVIDSLFVTPTPPHQGGEKPPREPRLFQHFFRRIWGWKICFVAYFTIWTILEYLIIRNCSTKYTIKSHKHTILTISDRERHIRTIYKIWKDFGLVCINIKCAMGKVCTLNTKDLSQRASWNYGLRRIWTSFNGVADFYRYAIRLYGFFIFRQAGNRFLGSLKGLQKRALVGHYYKPIPTRFPSPHRLFKNSSTGSMSLPTHSLPFHRRSADYSQSHSDSFSNFLRLKFMLAGDENDWRIAWMTGEPER